MIVGNSSLLPVPLVWGGLGVLALFAGGWWFRERRLSRQRGAMRALHALSEDIIAASSPAEIAELLAGRLPEATRATSITLYLFNPRSKALERVPTSSDPEPMVAPLDSPPDGLASAAVVCFRNRTQLNIPDVRRSPLVNVGPKTSLPRAALFMPLLTQNETLGVLEVHNDRKLGYFKPEEQAGVHHLANQAAASLKLQEQQAMREQLFRSEKLAATGQLISGVASDLRAPLDSILQLAESLAASAGRPAGEPELRRLAAEATRASEIVWRLVSFARQDQEGPQRFNFGELMVSLARFREPEWRILDLKQQVQTSGEAAWVAGVESQIEQVCLNLLVYAERRAAESATKTIVVKTTVLAGRAVTEIEYSAPGDAEGEADPFVSPKAEIVPGRPNLEVCLGILRNHGGDARLRRRSGLCAFEIELPLAAPAAQAAAPQAKANEHARPLTLLLVDPDPQAQRSLVTALGSKGHRVVPSSAEVAGDILQRLRFDAVLWAAQGGRNGWAEFHDRFRSSIPAFVLISDSYDPELARSLSPRNGFLLTRPVEEKKMAAVLTEISARAVKA